MNIQWTETELKIKDLKDYERNPRRINKTQFDNLVKSLKEDGYHQRLIVNQDGTIIGGHQRKKAFLAAGFNAEDTIKVLLPDRLLQENEFKRISIRDNATYGEFDMDILASDYDVEDLVEWGLAMGDWVNQIEEKAEEDVKAEKKKQQCPECGYEF